MRVFRIIVVWCLVALIWCICIVKGCAQNVPLIKVSHDSFVSYYDQQLKNPALVCYVLEWKHFSGNNRVAGRHFKADTKLPKPRVLDKDFTGSGYVRGHLCSAGDRDSDKKWLKETYLTSNLVPMTMVCNSGAWKVIEDSCRTLAKVGHRLIIARGPLYYDFVRSNANVVQIGSGEAANVLRTRVGITIPDGFFCFAKCLDCGLTYQSWCQNVGTRVLQDVIQDINGHPDEVLRFVRDDRVSVLLQNIIGTWSREVYETITR